VLLRGGNNLRKEARLAPTCSRTERGSASQGLANVEMCSRRRNPARSQGGWHHPVPSSKRQQAAEELRLKPVRKGERV